MKREISVKYYITTNCNYQCSYCTTKPIAVQYEPSKNDIDVMIENLKRYKINKFLFFGGEPTISKNFNYTIEQVQEKLNPNLIKIFTNGSNIKPLLDIQNKTNIYIISTIHFDYYNDKLLENNIKLKNSFDKYDLTLMIDKRYDNFITKFSEYKDIFKDNINLKIIFLENRVKFIIGDNKDLSDYRYAKHICDLYNVDIKSLIKREHVNKYYKNICNLSYYGILSNGDLIIPGCFSIKDKYNMYQYNDNELPQKSIVCDKNIVFCARQCDINNEKEKTR